jgi:hypothetical protein
MKAKDASIPERERAQQDGDGDDPDNEEDFRFSPNGSEQNNQHSPDRRRPNTSAETRR